jgi:hypothetical protein
VLEHGQTYQREHKGIDTDIHREGSPRGPFIQRATHDQLGKRPTFQ